MAIEDKRAGINSNDTDRVKPGFENQPPRNNMLSFFTYYADHSVVIRNTPGNIIVRDCIVEGADRFLHFNYSGNETWQNNRPLTSITFENIKATGVSMPLTSYGDVEEPLKLTMKNIDFSFREGFEHLDFLHMANIEELVMENVKIHNAARGVFIKMWGDKIPTCKFENIIGSPKEEYIVKAEEAFTCKTIW